MFMKNKTIAFALCILCFGFGCNAQNEQKSKAENQVDSSQPNVSWKVNKTYDQNGNVIGYDSTYIWSYTDTSGSVNRLYVDSVLEDFRKNFGSRYAPLFDKTFGDPVWSDGLFWKNFTQPDYFRKQWKDRMSEMSILMRQMDSVRNNFLNEHYPGLIKEKQD